MKIPLNWVSSGATPPAEFVPPVDGDQLLAFLEWYGARGPSLPMAPPNGLEFRPDSLPGVTLYRAGRFQVQLFIFPAGTIVPPHRHPNVDTIEVYVAGDYDFRVGGISAIPMDHLHDYRNGVSRWWGRGVRVKPHDTHDLEVFEGGACFLSFQHWLAGAPSSVGLDWVGARPHANV